MPRHSSPAVTSRALPGSRLACPCLPYHAASHLVVSRKSVPILPCLAGPLRTNPEPAPPHLPTDAAPIRTLLCITCAARTYRASTRLSRTHRVQTCPTTPAKIHLDPPSLVRPCHAADMPI